MDEDIKKMLDQSFTGEQIEEAMVNIVAASFGTTNHLMLKDICSAIFSRLMIELTFKK